MQIEIHAMQLISASLQSSNATHNTGSTPESNDDGDALVKMQHPYNEWNDNW